MPGVSFFFYGTLMDRERLSRVLRRWVSPRELTPARLAGWRRCSVQGHDYPIVRPQRGALLSGLVIRHITTAERRLLCEYEGAGYRLHIAVAVIGDERRRRVSLFVPLSAAYAESRRPWSLPGGRLRQKALQRAAHRRDDRLHP